MDASETHCIWVSTLSPNSFWTFIFVFSWKYICAVSSAVRDPSVTLDSFLFQWPHLWLTLYVLHIFIWGDLRVGRSSALSSVIVMQVHALMCFQIDCCNVILIGLPNVLLSPLQSVLNTAAWLITCLPHCSCISTFMFGPLLSARVELKIVILVFKAQWGLGQKYLADIVLRPLSASSHCSLHSLSRPDL